MNRFYYIFFACLVFFGSIGSLQAQAPPTPLCADVQLDGSVILTWDLPSPTESWMNYEVYRNNGDNSFSLINTVGPSSLNSWLDGIGVDATTGPVQYYFQTTGNGTGGSSDTISTLFLDVSPLSGGSIAELEWNAPLTNIPAGSQFQIHRNVNGLGYQIIDFIDGDQTMYLDTLYGLCTGGATIPVKYKVAFENSTCTMFSQEDDGEFRDLLGPPPPLVETVLVNPFTGDVELYWYPSTASDLDYYLIQSLAQGPGGPAFNVGIVQEDENTMLLYEDASETAATNLVVIAFDDCPPSGNDESFDNVYTTMFVQSSYEDCSAEASIWWNPYEGWSEGVSHYRLHIQSNGGVFDVYDNLDPNQIVFTLEIVPNLDYCVYVEAISNGTQQPSTSNMTCFEAAYPEPISFNYLSNVTTVGENEIQIDLLQDPDAEGTTYQLLRSRAGSTFQVIGTYYQTSQEFLIVSDFDVDAEVTIYSYKWLAFDGCGQELFESNVSENMVLVPGTSNEGLINTLEWNPYVGWDGDVQEYEIYRKLGSELDFTLHASVGPSVTNWQEDVEQYMLEEGLFCYKIVAIENPNSYDKPAESVSSEACAIQDPLMWIPNTIVINGFNTEFAPVAGFIDFSTYEMEIHNRGGTQLFYSDDVTYGWTGTYQGRPVKEDYYRYTIVYRDGAGQYFLKQGALYVLRAEKQ